MTSKSDRFQLIQGGVEVAEQNWVETAQDWLRKHQVFAAGRPFPLHQSSEPIDNDSKPAGLHR
jgi:hypothetical protein